jgi:glycosyltransferase involved in cell wall biosynthesis
MVVGLKNLLVITNNYPDAQDRYIGGVFVKEQIRQISRSFDKVLVICPLPYGIGEIRGIKQRSYTHDNVEIRFLRYFNFPFFFFSGRRAWLALEERAVRRELRARQLMFDCVHAHYTWPSGMIATSLFSDTRVPVIITEHTSKTLDQAIAKKDPLFLQAWSRCDRVIRVRRGDIERFHQVGVPKERVSFVPNGYDSQKFKILDAEACRKHLQLPIAGKIVLSVGSLRSVKGHAYLIMAMAKLVSEGVDASCVIVGEGGLRRKLEKLSTRLHVQDAVRFAGNRPHSEIPTWINACDILAIPSLSEGNPTIMFEALGCGRPVVASRVGGIGEVIDDGEQGFLVAPSDSEELARRIKDALNRDWDREQIRSYAEQFSWERIASQIVTIYSDASSCHVKEDHGPPPAIR